MNKIIISFLLSFLCSMLFCSELYSQTTDSKPQTQKLLNSLEPGPEKTVQSKLPQEIIQILPGNVLHIRSPKFEQKNYWSKLGQTRTVMVAGEDFDDFYAGVDINAIPGEYLLSVETKKKQLTTFPYIVPTPTKRDFLDDNQHLDKSSPLAEKAALLKTLLWSNITPKLPLNFPANGDWTSTFGYFFEQKQEDNYRKKEKQTSILKIVDHISISFDQPTTILSPSDAICFLVELDPEHGYRVVLDHGMGLFSEISGLTNLTISEQDRVEKNALIASFNTNDFQGENDVLRSRTVRWRVFLNKSVINPNFLINLK